MFRAMRLCRLDFCPTALDRSEGSHPRISLPQRQKPAPVETDKGRRRFLTMSAALGAGALAGGTARAAESYPPNDAPWSQTLGPGVVEKPYGEPSEFVKDVIRRNVPWLTATPESSISFTPLQDQTGTITPNGLFFERYHAGRANVDPGSIN